MSPKLVRTEPHTVEIVFEIDIRQRQTECQVGRAISHKLNQLREPC